MPSHDRHVESGVCGIAVVLVAVVTVTQVVMIVIANPILTVNIRRNLTRIGSRLNAVVRIKIMIVVTRGIRNGVKTRKIEKTANIKRISTKNDTRRNVTKKVIVLMVMTF